MNKQPWGEEATSIGVKWGKISEYLFIYLFMVHGMMLSLQAIMDVWVSYVDVIHNQEEQRYVKQNLSIEWCLCLHLPSLLTDALVGSRGHRERGVQERVLSALLTEMDGIGVQRDALSAVCHLQVIINNAVVMDSLYKCNVVAACTLYLMDTMTWYCEHWMLCSKSVHSVEMLWQYGSATFGSCVYL